MLQVRLVINRDETMSRLSLRQRAGHIRHTEKGEWRHTVFGWMLNQAQVRAKLVQAIAFRSVGNCWKTTITLSIYCPPRHSLTLRVSQKRQIPRCNLVVLGRWWQIRNLIEIFSREVAGIGHASEMRHKGCVDVSDGRPVHAVKVGVGFDLLDGKAVLGVGKQSGRRCGVSGPSIDNCCS